MPISFFVNIALPTAFGFCWLAYALQKREDQLKEIYDINRLEQDMG